MDAILKNSFQNILAGYQKIADYTVSGSAINSYTFSSLNIAKEDDYILVFEGTTNTATNHDYLIYFNANENNTNYYSQRLNVDGSSFSAERANYPYFGYIEGNKKSFYICKIKLTNNGYIVAQMQELGAQGTSTIKMYNYVITSTYTATSITSIKVKSGYTTDIAVGSRFQLYKRVAPIIADVIVSTARTSIDFSNLNIDKGSEYMLVSDNKTTVSTDIALFVNSNTTQTNYYTQYIASSSTSVSGNRLNSSLFTWAGTSGNGFAIAKIKLTNNGYFVYQAEGIRQYGTSSINIFNGYATSMFTITSITSLTITSYNANGIGIGSRFQLIKLK